MSGTSSKTTFFSFGANDGFISRSFEGLRYRDLPSSLYDLIIGGSVLEVHWACLGPIPDSWVLSFKDSSEKNNLAWGPSSPQRLQNILSKATPSPHLRVFLGPKESFIAWDPNFIRWGSLPSSLEDCLQAWLTPAGWKAGPPRMISWSTEGAFFAMSEYGDVVYRLGNGDSWEIYKDTVEEWKGEKGFQWSELAFINLDPTIPDQFIAIRNDGTWAGSIDDSNEDALEAFALNFFRRAKTKTKTRSDNHQMNGHPKPTETVPSAAIQALYERWATDTASLFASALAANGGPRSKAPRKLQIRSQSSQATTQPSIPTVTKGKLLSQFPYLPTAITTCPLQECMSVKSDESGLKACKHDVEKLLRASGLYSYEWLRQERIRWHPDRFGRLCEENWREEGKRLAEEMFKVIDALLGDLERAGMTNGAS